MIDVVVDPVAALDQVSNAGAGPDVGGIAVGLRPVQQAFDQTLTLAAVELGFGTGMAASGQGLFAAVAVGLHPVTDGAGSYVQQPTDFGLGQSFVDDKVDGLASTLFQLFGSTVGSHRTPLL